jgi:hypothetical protein
MRITMPAGTYWIGDLCYAMDSRWNEVCGLIITGNEVEDGVFTLADGVVFAQHGTAYGDGAYRGTDGFDYGVDAGLIGMILDADILEEDKNISYKTGGRLTTFENEVTFEYEDGTFTFSDGRTELVIRTGADQEEDDDYDDWSGWADDDTEENED